MTKNNKGYTSMYKDWENNKESTYVIDIEGDSLFQRHLVYVLAEPKDKQGACRSR